MDDVDLRRVAASRSNQKGSVDSVLRSADLKRRQIHSFSAVRGPPASPVFGVPTGSMSRT
jgi:hypothetical protein